MPPLSTSLSLLEQASVRNDEVGGGLARSRKPTTGSQDLLPTAFFGLASD